jgi:hypothetical protein
MRLVSYREARQLLVGGRAGPGHVLGIDQAKASGWALIELAQQRCVLSGVAKTPAEQEDVLNLLAGLPGLFWPSVLVVLEDHSFMPTRAGTSARTLLSLGESRGRWLALLSERGHPPEARLLCTPAVWRKVLAKPGTRFTRATWKREAKRWASARVGERITSDDEAEAIAIAYWGSWEGLHRWALRESELTIPKNRPHPKPAPKRVAEG